MRTQKMLVYVLACALLLSGCAYIVTPEPEGRSASATEEGWGGVVTHVGKSDAGDLRFDIIIRNDTGEWSAMQAAAKPAVLKAGGKTTNCDAVSVGTGGHRLAPGFQMRGFTGGTKAEPVIHSPSPWHARGPKRPPGPSFH